MSSNSIEEEFKDIANRNAWPSIYQKIMRESLAFKHTCVEAKKPQNKHLNRYRDVSPYDHSRIILQRCDKDYINANLVQMTRANRKYILTQGPLNHTVKHFWAMVWEQKSRAILMLNKVIEKNEIKCHWYWPEDAGEDKKLELNDVNLTIEQISEEDFQYYTTRVFRIVDTETSESREVIQFHYTTWPDFGVPSSPHAFLEFLKKVRASGALEADVGPAVVHCSAGIGRSGTFCLVDSCLVIIEKEGIDNVNVQEILLEMRNYRMGLIQTPDQLRFSYQAIIEGAKRLDPKWVENNDQNMNQQIIVEDGEDEAPPPPPPRADSLKTPPSRPLPDLPPNMTIGDGQRRVERDDMSESSDISESSELESDDNAPPPPPRPNFDSSTEQSGARKRANNVSKQADASKFGDTDEPKKRPERSFYTPLALTLGCIVAGIAIYACVKLYR